MDRSMRWAHRLFLSCVLLLLVACGSTQPESIADNTTVTQPAPAAGQPAATATRVEPAATAPSGGADEEMSAPTTGTTSMLPTSSGAAGTIQRGLFVNLTTDDTWSAHMAISLAQTGRERGLEPVVIFLNVRGVYLADRERLPATEGNSEQNIHGKLQAFIAAGGQVIACPSCSREAGLTPEDYIDGVVLGEPGGAFQFLTDPTITVISYTGRNSDE